MAKIEKRASSDVAAERLRNAIVMGDLKLGSLLSEGELGEILGVSRTPIREAFRVLSQEGLICLAPFRGATVFDVTDAELREIIDFREVIECNALTVAMKTNYAALRDAMRAVKERMAKAVEEEDVRSYLTEDSAFHLTIVQSAQNAYFISANNLIASKMAAVRTVLGRDRDMFAGSWNTHKEIIDLIEKGDCDAAVARLRKHILDGKKLFTAP